MKVAWVGPVQQCRLFFQVVTLPSFFIMEVVVAVLRARILLFWVSLCVTPPKPEIFLKIKYNTNKKYLCFHLKFLRRYFNLLQISMTLPEGKQNYIFSPHLWIFVFTFLWTFFVHCCIQCCADAQEDLIKICKKYHDALLEIDATKVKLFIHPKNICVMNVTSSTKDLYYKI